MSLLSSLYSGASGIQSNSTDLSVIGDNISNANTIGFKAGRAAFEEALASSLMGLNGLGAGHEGLGVNLQAVQRILTQGALTNTGLATDLAIDGPGMFIVHGVAAGQEGDFYTRAGQFTVDANGLLVNLDGLAVQGYMADAAGNLSRSLGDLQIGEASSEPRATTVVTLKANLKADGPLDNPWDPTDPEATSSFSTSATVYDSLGAEHQVEVYFVKTADGQWEWHGLTDGSGVDGGIPGTPQEIASGTLSFDTDGKLVSQSSMSNFNPIGATPQTIDFDFGDDLNNGGTGVGGITQFAGTSEVTFLGQDGYESGALAAVTVDTDGQIIGSFTNGHNRVLGQVALADFEAGDQLRRLGGNLYGETVSSGQPTIGVPGGGGRGSIVGGALEQSNVDLASEFIRMITAQRGFQASSKVVTTSDQLLTELMNIKR